MVEVLICDSDKGFVLLGREAVGKVAAKYQQEVWVENYLNGGELIHALAQKEDTKLCIVLLDIDMPELGSYNVAKILSEQFPEVCFFLCLPERNWFILRSNIIHSGLLGRAILWQKYAMPCAGHLIYWNVG